jgi:2-polyprenyl-3-methyl-5-hydroxy-6-metoxy-1,4-benzoquinol methylase
MNMNYTSADYESDLNDPDMPHIRSRERFQAFYEHLAEGPAKRVTYPAHRMDWIEPTKGGWVIELGCHVGYNLVQWLNQDPDLEAWGVDVSQNMLAQAYNRLTKAHPDGSWRLLFGFIEDLEIGGQNYTHDVTDVVLTETLEHVIDPIPVLAKAVELSAHGTLWITTPQTRWGNYSHVRGITPAELGEMLREVGANPNGEIWGATGLTYAKISHSLNSLDPS